MIDIDATTEYASYLSQVPWVPNDTRDNVAMVHQPHFLPWPGYFARAAEADGLVILDDVKYKKQYFHNRTRMTTRDGREVWFTLPVKGSTQSGQIRDVELAKSPLNAGWDRRVSAYYGALPYFEEIWGPLKCLIERSAPSLLEINFSTIGWILGAVIEHSTFGETKIFRSSQVCETTDRTDRLIQACDAIGASALVLGFDAFHVHDIDRIKKAGISIKRHHHTSEVRRTPDGGPDLPRPGVTILESLFTLGFEGYAATLRHEWFFLPPGPGRLEP